MDAPCWSCGAPTRGEVFCPACAKISPLAPGGTHFDLFGVPPGVDVDVSALERQFRELSLKLHPDRFAQASTKERRISLERTTALNEAWKTLRDPVKRGFYLLKLAGIDLDREDAGAQRDMPLDFLEEVMELREALAVARGSGDLAKAQAMGEDVSSRRRTALEAALQALRARDVNTAAHQLGRVRYFQRFLDEVSAIEEEALG